MLHRHIALSLGVFFASCTAGGSGDPFSSQSNSSDETAGESGDTAADSATDDASSTSADDSSDTDDGPGIFDTAPPDLGAGPGCQEVDFLFVIDNSHSMAIHQESLIASFDPFISAIQATLESVSEYHVGVVTTDAYTYNDPGCAELGGLVLGTGGLYSSGEVCGPYAEGDNWMTDADDLDTAFSCAAQVGSQGSPYELPIAAMQAAVDGPLADPGGCNEGFLREDSLLVVVLLSDEADGPGDPDIDIDFNFPGPRTSPGTPDEWFDSLIAVRGGEEEKVVVLTLTYYDDGPCVPPTEVRDGANLVEFTELFTWGITGGICEADYGPYFEQATDVVDEACQNFPAG
jgi:hypothetical protein